MNNNTYVLPLEGYEELEKRVSKMNKKHKSSISLNIISRSIMKGDNGIEFPVVEFELVGDKPLLGTHEVLAIKQIDGGHVLIFGYLQKMFQRSIGRLKKIIATTVRPNGIGKRFLFSETFRLEKFSK